MAVPNKLPVITNNDDEGYPAMSVWWCQWAEGLDRHRGSVDWEVRGSREDLSSLGPPPRKP